MSEKTDATEDRDDVPEDPVEQDDSDTDEPQPWTKALPGDGD